MEAPITLGDSAIDRRKFISVLALVNNGGVQCRAYAASHPDASQATCRANAPAYFRDLGVRAEYLAQLEKRLDLEDICAKDQFYEIAKDPKTPASVRVRCWENIGKMTGEIVERSEVTNKNEPAVKALDPDELAELQTKADMILDDKWRKKESELSELQREVQQLKSDKEKLTSENARIKELYADAEEQLKIDGFNKIIN